MSELPLNPQTRSLTAVPFRAALSVHPDYTYWAEHWEEIRDAEVGEFEVKRKREKYLPKLAGQDAKEYNVYLRQAVFFNMTSRTLNALYGTVFSRMPKVSGFTAAMTEAARDISEDGTSLHLLAKTTVKEVLAMGRYGLLVDSDQEEGSAAYIAAYTTENILDWEMGKVNGKHQLIRVVLREIAYDRTDMWTPYEFKVRFRVLVLNTDLIDGPVYEQHIFEGLEGVVSRMPDLDSIPTDIITPLVREQPLDYIPFTTVGPFTNHPDVQKPPLSDIVTLNYSHYRSYAHLENGRFFTGAPIYTVQVGNGDGKAEYYVEPNRVWQLGAGEKAEILEFSGHGLRFLENALKDKEAQISAIGGRLMPGTARGASESDNSLALKERNEQTLLLNISDTVDEALTTVLRWWADWNNVPRARREKITFELNRDFLLKNAGAREFRAIQQMYEAGLIPLDVLYDFLLKTEVVPEWMSETEFAQKLNQAEQFPHMVDVLAQMKGFPDAKAYHEFEMAQMGMTQVQPNAGDPNAPPAMPAQTQNARTAETQAQSAPSEEPNA